MAARTFNIRRLLILGGILLPVVDLPLMYFFGSLHADYDRVRQFMSELGESGRPYAGLVNTWFAIVGLVLVGFGIAMAGMLPPSPISLMGVSLYLAWAGLGLAGAFFPCDPGCAGETWSGWIHRLLGEIGSVCIIPVPGLIWLGVRKDPRWRRFGWVALPVQVVVVVISLTLGASYYETLALGETLRNVAGLLQWLSWCVYYVWIVALGVKLLTVGGQGTA